MRLCSWPAASVHGRAIVGDRGDWRDGSAEKIEREKKESTGEVDDIAMSSAEAGRSVCKSKHRSFHGPQRWGGSRLAGLGNHPCPRPPNGAAHASTKELVEVPSSLAGPTCSAVACDT